MHEDQTSIAFFSEHEPPQTWTQLHAIFVDRGSKYSVTGGHILSRQKIKPFLDRIVQDKSYAKATHHIYAARVREGNRILDFKKDDGETGAGMIILRELQRANIVNVIIVVTRWYGGVQLHADRFAHVKNATLALLNDWRE